MLPLLSPSILALLPAGSAVLVGYSGGLDSSVLLHELAALPAMRGRLRAVHVHHGLHAAADDWAQHCRHACEALAVPLQVAPVRVARDSGEGLEAAARHARHAAFATELRDGEVLALAHHQDDQAETFLLRALRASGPDGLAAMRPWRRFGRGWLWRPLLDLPRARLLAYAQEHSLRWIDDPSNADTAFDRNFLRQRVLPLLRERWPHADAAFARAAGLCADTAELLAQEDARALAQVTTADPHVLSRTDLRLQPVVRRARVLRQWIASLGLPPLPAQGVSQIETQVLDARADAEAAFAWNGAIVRSWRDLLHADWQRAPLAADWRCEWDGHVPLPLADDALLRLDGISGFDSALVVHARQGGERILLPGRTHSHALKQVLQDLGVPVWVRERLPLVSDAEGELLAVGDLVYSARFDAWLRQHDARLVWEPT